MFSELSFQLSVSKSYLTIPFMFIMKKKKLSTMNFIICVPFLQQVFHSVAYKAHCREDLLAGIDEFLMQVTYVVHFCK